MTSVNFYHLQHSELKQVLPSLLTRSVQAKERGVVLCRDDAQVVELTEVLWRVTYPIWLPHGCHKTKKQDLYPEWQPIWLTIFEENLNQANFLFLVGGQNAFQIDQFKRVFDLFDGNDSEAVNSARQRWQNLKLLGHDLSYWQQGEKKWERKK